MNDCKGMGFLKKADYTGEIDFFGIGLNDIINTQSGVVNPNDAVRSRMSMEIAGFESSVKTKAQSKYTKLSKDCLRGIAHVVSVNDGQIDRSELINMALKDNRIRDYFAGRETDALEKEVPFELNGGNFYEVYKSAILHIMNSLEISDY